MVATAQGKRQEARSKKVNRVRIMSSKRRPRSASSVILSEGREAAEVEGSAFSEASDTQIPFDYAQGRLRLRDLTVASLRMTGSIYFGIRVPLGRGWGDSILASIRSSRSRCVSVTVYAPNDSSTTPRKMNGP